ncbi:MAG: HEPN domain-containing protein [Phycisphaerae bacterium]|nr:HEPN domain-containing protein [Phycisphaerae bacterium]
MNEIVREWISKAQGDYETALREPRAAPPNYDAACFHAQQCIEKLMKGMLQSGGIVPPRTHNLLELNERLKEILPEWACEVGDLRFLTRAATSFRYPGESASREDALEAIAACERMRDQLLRALPGEEP